MRGLARLKRLRGTPLDPFGWTAERRMERRLRDEYAAMLDEIATGLRPENHGVAVELAGLPDLVRGFGHVKERNAKVYEERRAVLLRRFDLPETPLPIAAE